METTGFQNCTVENIHFIIPPAGKLLYKTNLLQHNGSSLCSHTAGGRHDNVTKVYVDPGSGAVRHTEVITAQTQDKKVKCDQSRNFNNDYFHLLI